MDPDDTTLVARVTTSRCRRSEDIHCKTPRVSGCKSAFSADPSHHQVVSLIERTTSSTATFAWRDPTSCSYGEQIWRAARAKVSGICAISGARIKRGDLIFHPQRSKLAPANAGAMILASALNDVEPLQSAMAGVVE